MNKYQEALDRLNILTGEPIQVFKTGERMILGLREVAVLQELVDRATPMKPPKHDKVVCPRCNSKANYGHPYTEYCCHCGQKIDWTDTD